jgi:hypothetical protein
MRLGITGARVSTIDHDQDKSQPERPVRNAVRHSAMASIA